VKIATVIGARPQFIKAAVMSHQLRKHVDEIIIHTGQHYDVEMSDVFFQQLEIPRPNYFLGIGSDTHGSQTGRMLIEIEKKLCLEVPDCVLVYGDTNSTLAASLAAVKMHLPVVHIEAGLRSFNRKMPEEINRIITDHLSSLLFCPNQESVNHLLAEGIAQNVHLVGDIMCDAVLYYKDIALSRSRIMTRLSLTQHQYYLATIHRAENTDDPKRLAEILRAFSQLDHPVVFPVHPRTMKMVQQLGMKSMLTDGALCPIEPVDYFDMLALESMAKVILTDSGGIQKEAYILRVPCVTLRDETEWTETITYGWNRLTEISSSAILQAVSCSNPPAESLPIFGNGDAARKITKILTSFLQSVIERKHNPE